MDRNISNRNRNRLRESIRPGESRHPAALDAPALDGQGVARAQRARPDNESEAPARQRRRLLPRQLSPIGEALLAQPDSMQILARSMAGAIGPSSRTEFSEHWGAWARQGDPEENRAEAVARLTTFMDSAALNNKQLDLSLLGLKSLPEHLPPGLQTLDISGNNLTEVSDNITNQLGSVGLIKLGSSRMPEAVRSRLRKLTYASNYTGPQLDFSLPYANSTEPLARPLHEAVADWPDAHTQEAQALWCGFSGEVGAAEFSQVLDHLGRMVNFQGEAFKTHVGEWLSHLQQHPALRRETFAISQDAVISSQLAPSQDVRNQNTSVDSETAVALSPQDQAYETFTKMKEARVLFDVRNGAYNGRLPELLGLGLSMFYLDQLKSIAREHAVDKGLEDERVEIHQAYQVGLCERLRLPPETPSMAFFDEAKVGVEELEKALQQVQEALTQEEDGFLDYLACSWEPWSVVMSLVDPQVETKFAAATARGGEVDLQVQQQVNLNDLDDEALDHDELKELLGSFRAEHIKETQRQLTTEFIQNQGLGEEFERLLNR
jgi:C-terminal novel E3 ligase, LRR-interacting